MYNISCPQVIRRLYSFWLQSILFSPVSYLYFLPQIEHFRLGSQLRTTHLWLENTQHSRGPQSGVRLCHLSLRAFRNLCFHLCETWVKEGTIYTSQSIIVIFRLIGAKSNRPLIFVRLIVSFQNILLYIFYLFCSSNLS